MTAGAEPLTVVSINTEMTWRGGEGQTMSLVHGLRRRGHRSILIAKPDAIIARRAANQGIEVHTVRMRSELDVFSIWRLCRLFREWRPDVVHMHTSHAHTIGCLASLLSRRGARIVSRRVDFSIYRHRFSLSGFKYRYTGVDRFVAISAEIKRVLIEDSIPESRISTVYSGIDPNRFLHGDGAKARAELGVAKDAILIGTTAHFGWHKSLETLIQATPRIVAAVPRACVAILGDGSLRPFLESTRAKTNAADRIKMPGFRENVGDYLAAFDLFVMPSVMEGLCTAILDAFAVGVPVVASRAGGMVELVEDGKTGYLAAPGDPESLAGTIIKALNSPEKNTALVKAAKDKLHRSFTEDAMVEGNLAVYRQVLSQKPSTRPKRA